MRTETTDVCAYCRDEFLGERMVIRTSSLMLVLHPWCCRMLSLDLQKSFGSWFVEKYGANEKMNSLLFPK